MGIRAERRARRAETCAREQREREMREIARAEKELNQLDMDLGITKSIEYIVAFKKQNGRKPSEKEYLEWLMHENTR